MMTNKFDTIQFKARRNRWLWIFTIFIKMMLALGFIRSDYNLMSGSLNDLDKCKTQCAEAGDPEACITLCDYVRTARTYDSCTKEYENHPGPG